LLNSTNKNVLKVVYLASIFKKLDLWRELKLTLIYK